jgi:intracellular sulfur oxidation DsrE/DsrF family protein
MKKHEQISEEQLNAFVDGELESEERSCLFNEAELSEELDQRVCKQRKLKELVKHAYNDVPEPKHTKIYGFRTSLAGLSMAASVLLLIGILSGYFIGGLIGQNNPVGNPIDHHVANTGPGAAISSENYILHAISGDPEHMKRVLETAKDLLAESEGNVSRQIEVVANERGIDLLRSDVTPFGDEIAALADKQVLFYACSKSIQKLENDGIEVRLVPQANARYTALDRVVIRMKDGWQYIKI